MRYAFVTEQSRDRDYSLRKKIIITSKRIRSPFVFINEEITKNHSFTDNVSNTSMQSSERDIAFLSIHPRFLNAFFP